MTEIFRSGSSRCRHEGFATVHGPAKFLKENTVEIGCGTQLQGRYIVIATVAMPRSLDAPCAGHMSDNTQFMDLDQLPGRIVFVGGDYISCEFAHIAVRAGSKVSIIDWATGPSSHSTPISLTNWSNAAARQASTFICGQRCNRKRKSPGLCAPCREQRRRRVIDG